MYWFFYLVLLSVAAFSFWQSDRINVILNFNSFWHRRHIYRFLLSRRGIWFSRDASYWRCVTWLSLVCSTHWTWWIAAVTTCSLRYFQGLSVFGEGKNSHLHFLYKVQKCTWSGFYNKQLKQPKKYLVILSKYEKVISIYEDISFIYLRRKQTPMISRARWRTKSFPFSTRWCLFDATCSCWWWRTVTGRTTWQRRSWPIFCTPSRRWAVITVYSKQSIDIYYKNGKMLIFLPVFIFILINGNICYL